MDGHLHPGHALVLSMELDLGHATELGQHRGQVVLEVDDVTDPVTGTHQQSGGRLLNILAWENKKLIYKYPHPKHRTNIDADSSYQSNSVKQQSAERWKVIENSHVLQLPLERGDLGGR